MKRTPLKRKTPLKRTGFKRKKQKPLKKSWLKRKPPKKKKRKKDWIKTLHNACYKLWKEVCYKKWGRYCHVQRKYPEIRIKHTDVIQVDHCITRANKYFYYDIWNGTPVCSSCNRAKYFKQKSVDRAIEEIVRKRNPGWYKQAVAIDRMKEPNPSFNKIWWIEEIMQDLQGELDRVEGRRNFAKLLKGGS